MDQRHRPSTIRLGFVCVLMLALLALPGLFDPPQIEIWAPDEISIGSARAVPVHAVGPSDSITSIETEIIVPEGDSRNTPMALYLSGTFSAAAYWDNLRIGEKGHPADNHIEERPGQVDAILPIPAHLLSPGPHTVRLDLSSHHLQWPVRSIFHGNAQRPGLFVAPYNADARRDFSRYMTVFAVSGLCVSLIMVMLVYPGLGSPVRGEIACLIAALLVIAITETGRAFINYTYDWHLPRLAIQYLAAIGLSVALQALPKKILGRNRPFAFIVAGLLVFASFVWFLPLSMDRKTALVIVAGLIAACASFVRSDLPRDTRGFLTISAMPALLSGVIVPSSFLDGWLFAAVVPFLAWFSFPGVSGNTHKHLHVRADGRDYQFATDDILYFVAAGNYCEVTTRHGSILVKEPIKDILARLPASFVRIHRSAIVSTDRIRSLHRESTGRYMLETENGMRLPVSRKNVATLRQQMNQGLDGFGPPNSLR